MGEPLAEAKLVGGRYALESLLGQGGMGEVWRARHVALNTLVAIKFLVGASAHKLSTRKRFLTEAQVTAQLKTRHAVQVFDFGVTDDGQPYLVMELLDGETLGHRIARLKRLDVASTVQFLEQAARALDRAHGVGIVHRDFKPDNIVISVDEEGREAVKVLDFGIAKILNDLEASDADDGDALEGVQKAFATFTRTGTVLGTPLYMAPEQVRNSADLDMRADIWAFGVVAYQCLTGAPPFEGTNLIDLFERISKCEHAPARSLNDTLPEAFDQWFDIACAPDVSKRFASAKIAATQLAVALDARDALSSTSLRFVDSGRRASAGISSSGERPVAEITPPSDSFDALAEDALSKTMEAPRSVRGGVRRNEATASAPDAPSRFGKVPSVAPPPPAPLPSPALSPNEAQPSQFLGGTTERTDLGRGRRRATLLAVVLVVPLAVAATYRVAFVGATTPIPAPVGSAPSTASVIAIAPSPASSIQAASPDSTAANPNGAPTASAQPAAPDAGSPATARAPYGRASSLAPFAPPATTIATASAPAAAAKPPSPSPASPQSPPPAQSGASPFKLPPLGI
jgi:serine/threonine-protein kinase